jgi:hypothetical protein
MILTMQMFLIQYIIGRLVILPLLLSLFVILPSFLNFVILPFLFENERFVDTCF